MCSICGIENEWVQGFGLRDCLGGLGINWKIILKLDHKNGMAGHKLGSFIWLKFGTSCKLL